MEQKEEKKSKKFIISSLEVIVGMVTFVLIGFILDWFFGFF
jgi:hypothetical protein